MASSPIIVDDSALSSIAHRRLQKHNDQSADILVVNKGEDTPRILTMPILPRYESSESNEFSTPISTPMTTPVALWSLPDMLDSPISNKDDSSSPSMCSSSSQRSSFSDIEDDDISSEGSFDIFQARREPLRRVQPQRLRWEAGSLRREYQKYELARVSSDPATKAEEEKQQAEGSAVVPTPRSDANATSFFHHNTLRRHNSTGNYSRAQLSQAMLTPSIETSKKEFPEEKKVDAPEATKMLKSGGSKAQRQYDTRRREAKARNRHSYHPRAQISSRNSSLASSASDDQTSSSDNQFDITTLQVESTTISKMISEIKLLPPAPTESSQSSPQKTQQRPSHVKSLSKSNFTLTDKFFSGIRMVL